MLPAGLAYVSCIKVLLQPESNMGWPHACSTLGRALGSSWHLHLGRKTTQMLQRLTSAEISKQGRPSW